MKAMVIVAMLAALCLAASAQACTGDCDGDGQVTVDEVIQGVNIALGSAPLTQCQAFDADGGGAVTVDEIVAAVTNALNGCSATPTAQPTDTHPSTPMATPTNTSPPLSTPTSTPTSAQPPSTPTATANSTSPPPSTPTTTATADVVDGVSRRILGLFYGEVDCGFRLFDGTFLIQQTGTAEVQVTSFDRRFFNSIFATAETPTRIVYALSDPSIVHSLTLELVSTGQLMGTYTEGEGAGSFTCTLDLLLQAS